MNISIELQNKAINTIRFLAADAVQKANSGHPGLPMGAAVMAFTLWTRHLRFNPLNPDWHNRDRFILSGGHGSMLLYSLLHLTGYVLPLEEIKNFRQWGSITPGHPEYGLTPGVEVTTGPLGQGFANGVGMAIAQAHLGSIFNRPGLNIIDHYIYAIVTDGDLMEGVASEAASLAGHLRLGKLIYLYDDNRITIDGPTALAFSEDRAERFTAYGWQVIKIDNGNDPEAIDVALQQAKADPRPSLILCHTQIGFGLPTAAGTAKSHGTPPGEEELRQAKINLGWPTEPWFIIPDDVLTYFRQFQETGKKLEEEWGCLFDRYQNEYPEAAEELMRRLSGKLPLNWDKTLPEFAKDAKGMATRVASGKVLNALAKKLPEMIGGSADLTPSTNTWIENLPSFQPDDRTGRNLHFGVREHAMGSIINGMAVYKGLIPFGATFLIFSDYMRPAIRLSALSHYPSIWIFTHDSIGLGEDGPTHQPIEHLSALRAIPNLVVIRPGDANEVIEAWKVAIERRNGPTLIALTRQSVPTIDRQTYQAASGLRNGAYILADLGNGEPEIILMATGSEMSLIVEAGQKLAENGKKVRLVSFPSWELFEQQDLSYHEQILPSRITLRLAVEAGVAQGWEKWVGSKGRVINLERYGASAPEKTIFEHLGFTPENIVRQATEMLNGE
jgi:transketolase